jgi:hypothetical protein
VVKSDGYKNLPPHGRMGPNPHCLCHPTHKEVCETIVLLETSSYFFRLSLYSAIPCIPPRHLSPLACHLSWLPTSADLPLPTSLCQPPFAAFLYLPSPCLPSHSACPHPLPALTLPAFTLCLPSPSACPHNLPALTLCLPSPSACRHPLHALILCLPSVDPTSIWY